jgi:predicted NUDIX family NTP pyrophosphohydrolase
MARSSAGLLMFRTRNREVEVFLVHPGGPFWRKKDAGAWSLPKGESLPGEDLLATARREFAEETGIVAEGPLIDLGEAKQAGGKKVTAWAFERDCLPSIRSNTFSLEWPPGSGRIEQFPEVDRAEWFSLSEAQSRMHRGQGVFLDRLRLHLESSRPRH